MEKRIALIAHDQMKKDLLEWVEYNAKVLLPHNLITTQTTGRMLLDKIPDLQLTLVQSGPLGGDQEVGAAIAKREIDLLIFFWDGLNVHEHMNDILALLRLATIYNIPTACNRSTADMIVGSELFYSENYKPMVPDFSNYINRKIDV